ncbi:hypothetical protein M003_18130 [Pseudomonas aeruginosa IGB83]|nr:hypothetical protein M003_18130 [Pseudomonas aeruginosa IGB83]
MQTVIGTVLGGKKGQNALNTLLKRIQNSD